MTNFIKCFSILIASGNGNRCTELRERLRSQLLSYDNRTNTCKLQIFKYGRHDMPQDHERISKEVFSDIRFLFKDVGDHFFSIDNIKYKKTFTVLN